VLVVDPEAPEDQRDVEVPAGAELEEPPAGHGSTAHRLDAAHVVQGHLVRLPEPLVRQRHPLGDIALERHVDLVAVGH
jgi:hypothetical protein